MVQGVEMKKKKKARFTETTMFNLTFDEEEGISFDVSTLNNFTEEELNQISNILVKASLRRMGWSEKEIENLLEETLYIRKIDL